MKEEGKTAPTTEIDSTDEEPIRETTVDDEVRDNQVPENGPTMNTSDAALERKMENIGSEAGKVTIGAVPINNRDGAMKRGLRGSSRADREAKNRARAGVGSNRSLLKSDSNDESQQRNPALSKRILSYSSHADEDDIKSKKQQPNPTLANRILRYSNNNGDINSKELSRQLEEENNNNNSTQNPMGDTASNLFVGLSQSLRAMPDQEPGAFSASEPGAFSTSQRGQDPHITEDYGQVTQEGGSQNLTAPATRPNDYLVSAQLVETGSEASIARAEVVEKRKFGCIPKSKHGKRLCLAVIVALCIIATTGIVCGTGACTADSKDDNEDVVLEQAQPTASEQEIDPFANLTTMERVHKRDEVHCAVYAKNGIDIDTSPGSSQLFNIAMCRAVAAMVLNDPNKIKLVPAMSKTWLQLLGNRTVDILTMPATLTMERDVHHTATKAGFAFTAPFYYSGLRFAVSSEDIKNCIDKFDVSNGICRDVKLCIQEGGHHKEIIAEHMPAAVAIVEKGTPHCIDRFVEGKVNAVVGEPGVTVSRKRFQEAGYTGDLFYTKNLLSREPNAMAALDLDPDWADMVTLAMDAIFAAERIGLTQEDAQKNTSLVAAWEGAHPNLINLILKAVGAGGNYGELYNRTIKEATGLPRGGLNMLNDNNTTGLMYSFPFGYNNDDFDHTITPGPKILELKEKGMLRCGVHERPGFAEVNTATNGTWFGMEVELCKSVAASLFRTEVDTLEIVNLDPGTGFMALEDGVVDVVAGQLVTLSNKYHEPTTGLSFRFSPPYFYSAESEDIFALATSRHDAKWSAFVFWTVMALIHAEENGITSEDAVLMPPINLFGVDFKQMFIDCIARVGNYGDIYNRTLGPRLPRTGRNLLNSIEAGMGPQQLALPI